ncbi:MAG: diacylglycerol kinase family protein [Cyclobacteriaceae bacterium]
MKKATVLHNPEAGEGETSKRELINKIESAGFKCSYSSTKQYRWENIETEDIEFLILAGGDGTVRKVAEELLSRKVIEKKLSLALLPLGTANNIAKTLGLDGSTREIIEGWQEGTSKKFDVGMIDGLDEPSFFLEAFGYGLFPKLMQQMKKQKKDDISDPKEKMQAALELLYDLIIEAPVKKCSLKINDIDYSGEFLLVEVMNIRSIGPNLNLAPEADPGDGEFDVVLITENQRKALAEYVRKKMNGKEVQFDFPLLKAKELEILWDGKHAHVDDEYYKIEKPLRIKIEVREGLLEFLLPAE